MKELSVGQKAEKDFIVTKETGVAYADVSGDKNPLHLDENYAKNTRFGREIAHGMLLGGYISGRSEERRVGKECRL